MKGQLLEHWTEMNGGSNLAEGVLFFLFFPKTANCIISDGLSKKIDIARPLSNSCLILIKMFSMK